MFISKKAEDKSSFRRIFKYFPNARTGIRFVIEQFDIAKQGILLPSYIGWSPKEGSGVFDPIKELRCKYDFYMIKNGLQIDMDDFCYKLRILKPKAVLVIHYFGFVDKNISKISSLCRANRVLLIEDQAHSMLSDLIGGISGMYGDISIYSLHKILPLKKGGVVVMKPIYDNARESSYFRFFQYNLSAISKRRVENWNYILNILKNSNNHNISPLFNNLRPGTVPQSFPVLINKGDRDNIYFELNAEGYGVTSLYHTLIEEIDKREFPEAYEVSKRILNLPVHQNANIKCIRNMMKRLQSLTGRLNDKSIR